ncbi:hypothetical protein GCM10027072_01280 [Streptomyces bullii]
MGGQGVGVGEAEAAAAAGDDGGLAGEIDAGHGTVPSHEDAVVRMRDAVTQIEAKSNNWRRQ